MILVDSKILSHLYSKSIIAYGTGRVGRILIPYLVQDPKIKLYGVANSRIGIGEEKFFLDTHLPIRNIHTWAKFVPEATILVTTTNPAFQMEISDICQNAGYTDIAFVDQNLVNSIAYTHINSFAIARKDYFDECELWSRAEANPLLSLMCLANEIHDTHKQSFAEFRACNRGKSIAVLGTGPTLNHYFPIRGISHIGVNSSFKRSDIKLNYYFLGHYVPEWCNELKQFNFEKFFSYHKADGFVDEFPQHIIEENNGRRYYLGFPGKTIYHNIEYYPLMSFSSIIFSAIHFALYTRPKQILLVGCDCASSGHFDTDICGYDQEAAAPAWLDGYQRVKAFVSHYHPDIEFISVNPVGLKGIFRDVYTESYLDAHPEIDRSTVEILNPADYEEK